LKTFFYFRHTFWDGYLIGYNINAQIDCNIKLNENNYKVTVNRIILNSNDSYELTFHYPQRVFKIDESDSSLLKLKNRHFCIFIDTLLKTDMTTIKENIQLFYNVAANDYNKLEDKKASKNSKYKFVEKEINYNVKKYYNLDSIQLIFAYIEISNAIKNYSIISDIKTEKPAGNFIIKKEIPVYEKSRAIPLSFMPQLNNYLNYSNKKKPVDGVSLNNKPFINYNLLKTIKINLKQDTAKPLKNDTNKLLKIEIRKFKRKLRRLQNRKWKNFVRYKGNKMSDAKKINTTIVKDGKITFENSTIKYFKINTINDTTYYSTYSISLKSHAAISRNYENRLYCRYQSNSNKRYFIKLGDVFKYNYLLQNYSDDFSPKDTSINFTVKDNKIKCKVNKQAMSSIFDIRVYSDLTSLFGNLPAGIIQTEAIAHFKLNTNWPRRTSIKFFNYFESSFNYASFKDEFSSLLINDFKWGEDSIVKVDAFDLQRYSNYNSGIIINFVRIGFKRLSSTVDVNLFGNILNTNISYNTVDSTTINLANTDTTIATNNSLIKKNLYSVTYGTNFRWRTMMSSKFGVDISLRLYGLGLINSGKDYELVNYTSINKLENIKSVQRNKLAFFYNPSITLFYRPNIGGAGSLFFRSTYFGCFGNNINSYLFIQLGYSLSINNIIKQNKN